jgi:glycosyltransferase involved in cell wall biosynthesis
MYNEEENVVSTLAQVKETLKPFGQSYEIIPVNDGSTDNTLKVLNDAASIDHHIHVVTYEKNGGRGKALRYGFRQAKGEYIASIDADLSYDPKYILEMTQVLDNENDIDAVLLSPYMKGGKAEGVPSSRLIPSRLGNWVLQLAMPEKVYTITCIARCYRKEVIASLDLESDEKEIHLEILSKMLAMGFKIKEIPATLKTRKKGKSKFSFGSIAYSHLFFTMFERPILLFGILGVLLTLIGLGIGAYIVSLYFAGALNPNRPIMVFMVLFILAGIQILSFGFIASQIKFLRKEVLRTRRALAETEAKLLNSQPDNSDSQQK